MFGEIWVERIGALHAFAVVVEHLLQRGKAPVVHVGRGHGDVAQARRGEGAAIDVFLRHFESAEIRFVNGQPVIAKLMIREERPAMRRSQTGLQSRKSAQASGWKRSLRCG